MFAPPYVEYAFVTFRGPMALSSRHTRNCVRVSVMAIARLSESGFDRSSTVSGIVFQDDQVLERLGGRYLVADFKM